MEFNDSSSLNTRNQCALPTHPEAISRNVKKWILAKNHITSFPKVVLFRNLALNCEQRNWFEQNLKPRHIYIFKHVYFDRVSLVYTSQLSTSSHSFKYYQNEHHTQAIYIAFHGNKQSRIAHVKSFFSASILIIPSILLHYNVA